MSKPSIKYDVLLIRVSELQTTRVVVAPWETPVLRAIYGDDLEVTGEEVINRAPPEAEDEFARLALKYGPKNSDTPTVAAVYGNFGPGVTKLFNTINRAYGFSGESAQVIESGVDEVPELTDEQIDAISAAGDAAQDALVVSAEIIEATEPQPPIESDNPAIETPEVDDSEDAGLAELVG